MTRLEGKKPTTKIWLFCEGQTEHNYFSKLKSVERISRLQIEVHSSHNTDAVGVLNYAKGYKDSHQRDFQEGDFVYCIFDRDQNNAKQLQDAQTLAHDNNFSIIFSNPSFEYWFLCHFEYHPTATETKDIIPTLKTKIPGGYDKTDKFLYEKTVKEQPTAIKNAKQIHAKHQKDGKETVHKDTNPVTTVYEIINLLETFKE